MEISVRMASNSFQKLNQTIMDELRKLNHIIMDVLRKLKHVLNDPTEPGWLPDTTPFSGILVI